MASGSSATPSANQRSISDATGELTRQQIQSLRSEEWTEEHEAELIELKAKLKAAHKSWSAEQELYHDRVGSPYNPYGTQATGLMIQFSTARAFGGHEAQGQEGGKEGRQNG